jgi:hypothetical protein
LHVYLGVESSNQGLVSHAASSLPHRLGLLEQSGRPTERHHLALLERNDVRLDATDRVAREREDVAEDEPMELTALVGGLTVADRDTASPSSISRSTVKVGLPMNSSFSIS